MSAVHNAEQGAPAQLRVLQVFRTCGGCGVVVGRDPRSFARATGVGLGRVAEPELALASLLSEREASGAVDATVVLRIAHRDDAQWATAVLRWLVARGRRVIIRTRVVLPKALSEDVRELGATVLLELAARSVAVQRALLSPDADSVARLLLHAQHLRSSGVRVAASVGPVLAVLHDRLESLGPLLRHVAAADLTDVHIAVGRLTVERFAALADALPWSEMTAIGRMYGVPGGDTRTIPATGARLAERDAATVFHSARREAEATGLRVDACGCSALCHISKPKALPFAPLLTPELFTDVG